MRNTRLPGHGLQREGRAFELADFAGTALRYTGNADGYGVCSCGAWSSWLPSTAARKRWHEEHKAKVLGESEA